MPIVTPFPVLKTRLRVDQNSMKLVVNCVRLVKVDQKNREKKKRKNEHRLNKERQKKQGSKGSIQESGGQIQGIDQSPSKGTCKGSVQE